MASEIASLHQADDLFKDALAARIAEMAKTWPEVIPATELSRLLCGLYTAKTLANRRWAGLPPRSLKLGRKSIYLKPDVTDWLVSEIREFTPDTAA